ncbi:MAG: putative Serine/threonine-protein kinase ppk15 [Streblomastix strix]|uniref:Putative Serine/threonine-protein kinase ppk15 n=1 Tax=Streblomastix strix TaxID=222440 RepID=A0A5J4X282_9EUKA|nr:MAG: putative Serine/threonine-protein kinase ppk15 [Streblomastix strix]
MFNWQLAADVSTTSKATLFLVELYQKCQPFKSYKRKIKNAGLVLTQPSEGVSNDGYDNINDDFILHVGDIIMPYPAPRNTICIGYQVETLLGQGSFGQVVRCINLQTRMLVAVKVVKNQAAFTQQAQYESRILRILRDNDELGIRHVIHFIEDFSFRGHVCFVTELLGEDLYSVMKTGHFRGFTLPMISAVLQQILDACALSSDLQLVHCDLKPENILVDQQLPNIKVIDFGSAVGERHPVYTYIQSRYYRAPEILAGWRYNSRIDMWSVGCIAAELFLGYPLFPGGSEYDQICRIFNMLGPFPAQMVKEGTNFSKFFVLDENEVEIEYVAGVEYRLRRKIGQLTQGDGYRLMTLDEFKVHSQQPDVQPTKQYSYIYGSLQDTIQAYSNKLLRENEFSMRGKADKRPFLSFLNQLLQIDPRKRASAKRALNHPFIVGGGFDKPLLIYKLDENGNQVEDDDNMNDEEKQRKKKLKLSQKRRKKRLKKMQLKLQQKQLNVQNGEQDDDSNVSSDGEEYDEQKQLLYSDGEDGENENENENDDNNSFDEDLVDNVDDEPNEEKLKLLRWPVATLNAMKKYSLITGAKFQENPVKIFTDRHIPKHKQ